MAEVLKASELAIGYGKAVISENLNISLESGVVTAMLGANGSGKSTLIKTISGNLKPLKGEIFIEGKSIRNLSRQQLAKIISVVTTETDMAGGLLVEELVSLGRIPYTGALGKLSVEDKAVIGDAIEKVGIEHKSKSFVANLSDGEKQKAMIARGLAQDTPILIMDEPFSFLDVAARIEILLLLKEIAASKNKAILYSTHEATQALRMVEKIWMFIGENSTKQVVEGTPEELIEQGYPAKLFDSESVCFDPEMRDFIAKNK